MNRSNLLTLALFYIDPFLSGLGRAAEQVQKGVIPNKSRAEEIATQQFNAAKKEQSVSENNKSSFFKRRKAANHRRSKSLGKVGRSAASKANYLRCGHLAGGQSATLTKSHTGHNKPQTAR